MRRRKKKFAPPRAKAALSPISAQRKREISAQFKDDVLAKLVDAFFQVVEKEGWGKRDLATISGMNETAIGHILAGRRRNVELETIAILTRAMRTRPELLLHNLRPRGNYPEGSKVDSAADVLNEKQAKQSLVEQKPSIGIARSQPTSGSLREAVFE